MRLKPKIKHKNSGKAKGYKDSDYLEYMHNSNQTCCMCGNSSIELHHVKCRSIVGRDDRFVIPLCVEHHLGSERSPHGNPANFMSKEDQKNLAIKYYQDYLLI